MDINNVLKQSPALPTLPQVVRELIVSLDDDQVAMADVAAKLATDQALSAKVLKLANSAYYNAPRSIGTVDEALRMLGLSTVRTMVLSAGMTGSFKPVDGLDLAVFWRYGLHAAVAARYLAKTAAIDLDPEVAFTVGLLHGIGRLVMGATMGAELKSLPAGLSAFPCRDRVDVERAAFGFSYADVGAGLTAQWNFPLAFCEAIGEAGAPADDASALGALVHVAAWLSRLDEEGAAPEQARAAFPHRAAACAGLTINGVLQELPPLRELSHGLEELVRAH